MFGSAIEFVLRAHTVEGDKPAGNIKADGSMHSYKKQFHADWILCPEKLNDTIWITTPIYPESGMHLPDILKKMETHCKSWKSDKKILIYAADQQWAEINMLFQYHKISVGENFGLDIIFSGLDQSNVKQWNPLYQVFSDLKPWELREWLSLFYPSWVEEWINSVECVDADVLAVSNQELIEHTESAFEKIINFCELTQQDSLKQFAFAYQSAQKYVLDEYKTIENIVQYSISKQRYSWNDISPVSEAIVQQKLRAHGFEIRCDGLDVFPTDSITLHNLLTNQSIH